MVATLHHKYGLIFFVVFALFLVDNSFAEENSQDTAIWPQWRGPLGTGVGVDVRPPLEWNDTKNIRWKTKIPGRGHSTPIVWKNHIFLTSAVPIGEKLPPKYSGRPGEHDNLPITSRQAFHVIAINRSNGKILWKKIVHDAIPHEGAHYSGSLASNSAVTDGKHVYAFFGSYGLYCLDFEGNVKWQKDFGDMHSKHGHGEGSSPALFEDQIVVNWDHEEQSFVVVLDKRTGDEIWRKQRSEVTSWATPIVIDYQGQPQLIVCGTSRVRSYDLKKGTVIWECAGLSSNIVATPVYADGFVYAGSSYEKRAFLAIDLANATGDITGTKNVVWNKFRGTPYVPSPLLYDDALYFLTHYQGIMTRLIAKTGEESPGAIRLNGIHNVYASPVGAADRVYVSDLDGTTVVIQHGTIPRILATNRIDDSFSASAAIVEDMILLRGDKALYCIADES